MHPPVYLDYHATTPVDPRVLEAMLPFFGPKFGNAASRGHRFGWEAEKAVELARRRVAELAGAGPREIVFTSGATESNNLAIKGAGRRAHRHPGYRAQSGARPGQTLAAGRLTVLRPRPDGLIDLEELRAAIRPEPTLVSVMWANNEIGVIQPVDEIGAICRETRRALPLRRGPGLRQSAGERGTRGPDVVQRAQDVRAEGRGRALCAPQTRPAHAPDGWRRPRIRPALGHAERAGHRGIWRGLRHLRPGNGGRSRPRRRACATV